MNKTWKRAATFFGLAMLYVSPVSAQTWDSLLQTIRKRFPAVRQLSTRELAAWLADPKPGNAPLLVDVREPKEFAVSHLPQACNLSSVAGIKAAVSSAGQPVVVYCSVGYRSSAIADKLRHAGLTNAFNLEGSIFAWANEGRPVYRGEKELKPAKVHPYDEKWGKLLAEQLRAPLK